jgi:vesicle transport through interaction with t-SNAREs 1
MFYGNNKIPLYRAKDAIISLSVDVECELVEAEAYIRAMDIEFRSIPSGEKKATSIKVNEYKEELKQLGISFSKTRRDAEEVAMKAGSASRAKLIAANQKLDKSTAALEQSRQLIAQSDALGNNILSDMENQKEQLIESKVKVDETIGFTENARAVLITMGNRALRHTACVAFVIFLLAGLNALTIYFAFIDKSK